MEELGVKWLHLDQMDGHFVPNISFGPDALAAIRRKTKLFLDVHLMLSDPRRYIAEYARAGADLITVHAEIEDDVEDLLREIAALSVKTGVSIKPGTPQEAIGRLLPLCDLVLVMTVEPGCAVRAAVERGELGAQRYARYRELLAQIREQWKGRYV